MESHLKKIYRLNVTTLFLLVIYGVYLLRNVIFVLYKEIESKILAGILIPFTCFVIIALLLSSNSAMSRELYDRNKQKWAAILYVCFVFSSDVLIIYAFMSFHILGKLFFILNNVMAFLHLRRYLISFADHNRLSF